MNSKKIKEAAELLAKREEMHALRSYLVAKPSFKLGLYAADGGGTMYEDFHVSNELGRGLLNMAINSNSEALAQIGVEEFSQSEQAALKQSEKMP